MQPSSYFCKSLHRATAKGARRWNRNTPRHVQVSLVAAASPENSVNGAGKSPKNWKRKRKAVYASASVFFVANMDHVECALPICPCTILAECTAESLGQGPTSELTHQPILL